jgi:hypothetical protein
MMYLPFLCVGKAGAESVGFATLASAGGDAIIGWLTGPARPFPSTGSAIALLVVYFPQPSAQRLATV